VRPAEDLEQVRAILNLPPEEKLPEPEGVYNEQARWWEFTMKRPVPALSTIEHGKG
jgi:hypothetical protein